MKGTYFSVSLAIEHRLGVLEVLMYLFVLNISYSRSFTCQDMRALDTP